MKRFEEFIDSHEKALANVFAFVMTFLLLWSISAETDTARANDVANHPAYTEDVFVFTRVPYGHWRYRSAKIKAIPNMFPVACFETPPKVLVQCFFTDGNGVARLDDMELVGEKRT